MATTVTTPVNAPTSTTAPQGILPPGYRLPAATRIGHVRLQVSNLARSLDYYQQVLGLRVLARTHDHATLGAAGDDAPLVVLHERHGVTPVPKRGRLGLYHFAILLPNRAELGRFINHLAAVGVQAGAADHFVSEALYLWDPDGLGIEVYADRPRSAWRFNGSEMSMTTIQLDVSDVIRAAGTTTWAGMPAGTVMGHVHLSVGDLEQAAAFYHGALGLDKTVWSYPGALFLSAGGYHHHLGTNIWAAAAPRASELDARLLDWAMILPSWDDADAAARSLTAAGYAAVRAEDGWHAPDPWGTTLRLVGADGR
jgi:catechol 2,3-dioxygenase